MNKEVKLELLKSDMDLISIKIFQVQIEKDYHEQLAVNKQSEIKELIDRSQILLDLIESKDV